MIYQRPSSTKRPHYAYVGAGGFAILGILLFVCMLLARGVPEKPLMEINPALPADLKAYMNQIALANDQAQTGLEHVHDSLARLRNNPDLRFDKDWAIEFEASNALLELSAEHFRHLGTVPEGMLSTEIACKNIGDHLILERGMTQESVAASDGAVTPGMKNMESNINFASGYVISHIRSLNDPQASRELLAHRFSALEAHQILGAGGSTDRATGTIRTPTSTGKILKVKFEQDHVSSVTIEEPNGIDQSLQRSIQTGAG